MCFDSAQCKQKGSIYPLVLIGILLIGAAGYRFYNRPVPIVEMPMPSLEKKENIQIYSSDEIGHEFKYNSDLNIVKEDSEEKFNERGNGNFRKNFKNYVGYEPGKVLGVVVVLGQDNSYETNPLTIWVFDNPDNLSIDKWYHNFWYYPFVWGDFTYSGKAKLAPSNEATISGQPAKSGIIDYQPGKPKFVYLSKDGKMYLFRVIGKEGDQSLSSFQFLE